MVPTSADFESSLKVTLKSKFPMVQTIQMCSLSVLTDHITIRFGLYMWPSSADFRDTKYQQ
jgi:hypothetical protein